MIYIELNIAWDDLQCAPQKLSPLNIKVATFTDIAASWNFSCVCGLPLCWCWRFFTILRQKRFVLRAFLQEKMRLAILQASFFFVSARKLAKQNVFALGWWKIVSISIKASHIHRKISGCCNFYGGSNCRYSAPQWIWDLKCM